MKGSCFSEEQTLGRLKERQAEFGARDLCRKMGSAIFYKWRSKYGGIEVSNARRLVRLERQNAKLKSWRDQKKPQWGDFPNKNWRSI